MDNVSAIAVAHSISDSISVPIEIDGHLHRIEGVSTGIVDVNLPSVSLLTEESTPRERKVADDAEDNFNAAAMTLIESGQQFYTDLRPNWALRSFLWKVIEREEPSDDVPQRISTEEAE